jgi:uncharacterized protein (DUF697 family)
MIKSIFDTIASKFKPMNRKEQAQKIVQNHMLFAGGAGLVPIPGVDMVAVAAVQIEMLRQLSSLYEHTFSENQIKNYLSAFTGGILARLGSSALKGIPVIGTALGSATMALTSSASTYAIGQVFVSHYETGGTNENFDAEAFRKLYEQELKKGKEMAKNMGKNGNNSNNSNNTETPQKEMPKTNDIVDQIKMLGDLKDKGLLSDDEFKAAKAKLLANI